MNSLTDKTVKMSEEFKRMLIMKIKEHPCVWTKTNKLENDIESVRRHEVWKQIERELGFPCALKEMQANWSTLSEKYFRIIFLKTIERNFEAPEWLFFHDMTFLYEHVKETIQHLLGGISPPLFKPNPKSDGSKKPKCPCCVYIASKASSIPVISLLEIKQEDEFKNPSTLMTEKSYENNPESKILHSRSTEGSEYKSCSLTNSPVPQQSGASKSSIEISNPDLMKTKTFTESIDTLSGNKTESRSQLSPAALEPMKDNHPLEVHGSHPMEVNKCIALKKRESAVAVKNLKSSLVISERLEDGVSFEEQGTLSNEQKTAPVNTPKEVLALVDKSNEELVNLVSKSAKLRTITRSQIIQAIKANPASYLIDYTCTKRRKQYIAAWKRIAEQLGNVPLQPVKNRWKLIKTRYLKELVLEHYSKGSQKSSWECFDELEFLRPHMQDNIEDIHRTRVQIQKLITNKTGESINCVESSLKLSDIVLKDNKVANISYIKESVNDQIKFNVQPQRSGANVIKSTNIQIASIKTLKPQIPTEKEWMEKSVIIDANTLPILKNRPVTITAVKVLQTNGFNNESNKNLEAPSPAKKFRKSTSSEVNARNEAENEMPRRQSMPYIPDSATERGITFPNLTKLQSVTTAKSSLTTVQSVLNCHPSLSTANPAITAKLTAAQPITIYKPSLPAVQHALSVKPSIITAQLVKTVKPFLNTSQPFITAKPCLATIQAVKTVDPRLTALQPANAVESTLTTVQTVLQQDKSQKILQTLDLTLDDDVSMTKAHISNEIDAQNLQSYSNEDCVYKSKEFPLLDLTTDENLDEDKNTSKKEQAISTEKKDDRYVICLDDDDSVGSYEEVIVYLSNDKNTCDE